MKIRLLLYLSTPVLLCALAGAQVQDPLPSWNDGAAKRTILNFVRETTDPSSPNFVPPGQRVANFDQGRNAWIAYLPMRELERYLRVNGYKTVAEGEQKPVCVVAEEVYGIQPEQQVGTGLSAGVNCLAMLVLHDEAQRVPEDSIGTSAQALCDQAQSRGWTVISMKKDWKRRFASDESGPWDPPPPGSWLFQEPVVASSGDISATTSSTPVL